MAYRGRIYAGGLTGEDMENDDRQQTYRLMGVGLSRAELTAWTGLPSDRVAVYDHVVSATVDLLLGTEDRVRDIVVLACQVMGGLELEFMEWLTGRGICAVRLVRDEGDFQGAGVGDRVSPDELRGWLGRQLETKAAVQVVKLEADPSGPRSDRVSLSQAELDSLMR